MAERYFAATTAAIRRADPNHMVLGCRFAGGPSGVHPVVMEIAGKYCDIVSFNHYPWADLDQGVVFDSRANQMPVTDLYRAAHDNAKRPLFLTEWSFPALDAGMPCTHGAGQRFRTQGERVQASELYARTLLSLPFFTGYSYFRWVDQPPLGIRKTFPENSNYGLISEQGVPYAGLTAMFARVQRGRGSLEAGDGRRVAGDGRAAGGQRQESERERFFAEAGVSRGAAPSVPAVGFRQDADGSWTLSNGLVRLSGRVGGKYMADEVAYSQELATSAAPANSSFVIRHSSLPDAWRPVGRWGALLEGEKDGIPYWTDVSRVTDVSFARDEATGIVTATIRAEGEGRADGSRRAPAGAQTGPSSAEGDPRFAFIHRLSLAPGRADILAEIVSLENTGATPFLVKVLFMRPFAIQAEPGETETVPNLWKGPSEDYWALDDGSRWGVSSCDAGFLKARLWYREEDRSQHPDVRCMEGKPFVLAPGATFRPTLPMGALVRFLPPESYGSSQ